MQNSLGNIYWLDEVTSTNSVLYDWVKNHTVKYGDILVADVQTTGRGREDRVWVSEKGNLFFSLYMPLVNQKDEVSALSFISACACVAALGDDRIQLKWPNDIFFNEKKCGGILLEKHCLNNADFVIIGIGINLSSFPADTMMPATDIKALGCSRDEFLEKWTAAFSDFYKQWEMFGFSVIRKYWLNHAIGLGKEISILQNEKQGIFKDIDEAGRLILEADNGDVTYIVTGDVFLKGEE